MKSNQLDWNAAYAVPAEMTFRLTPGGTFQVASDGTDGSVEVAGGHVALLMGFSRPLAAEAAFTQANAKWRIERDTFRRLLAVWIAQGLLQTPEASEHATTRLALFAKAMAQHAPVSDRPFPLVSHFPLQRPRVFYPGLTTMEVHDRQRFPWVAALEDACSVIQREFAGLLASADFARVHPAYTSRGEWAAAYLWAFGERVEEVCRLCPETDRLLGSIPGVAEFGTTLFSALGPHSHIAPHYGYTNAKLRCQLPLRVPGDCRLKVGDQQIQQEEGRCILFDDSFLHSAWNDNDEPRFVLIFDFYHPDLTSDEIRYLSRVAQEKALARQHLGAAATAEKAVWVKESPSRPGEDR